ncbi:MAG: ATP-dependent helicase [Janthinobacterium lividum]
MTSYLERLNPEQREAVETVDGPLLVLAGAGTGKTRVLTTRFAHILLSGRAFPNQVLAVTFTNRASREMRERVAVILGRPVEGLWLGTFHALCARMLRRHAEYVGLTSSFTILDTDDQLRLLKQVMELHRIDIKRWPAPGLMGAIQRWKDRGLTPDRITPSEDTDFAGGKARQIYGDYQERLRQLNAADFGDLMLHIVEILRTRPDVLAQYHRTFRYILVDEYQDTNTIQYLWLRLLAQREGFPSNICCVGDDDQSIYSWRGAEVENILRFEKDFPGATIVRLESNYRSTAPILAAASGLIAHNEGRMGKTLRPGREDSQGDKVLIASVWDSDEEARLVGERIEQLHREGSTLSEMAILVRAGFQTRAFEERMITLGLPYRVIGGMRFYERAEIRDAIAYMRAMNQPADDLAFERIINLPRRGVGDVALSALHSRARADRVPMTEAVLRLLADGTLKGRVRDQLGQLMATLERGRIGLAESAQAEQIAPVHIRVVETLLEESGYIDMWKRDKSPDAPGRLDNLKELIRALVDFETLGGFLEHVSLVMENDENAGADRVNLMTLHGAKGLEFDNVFLPGWEEGLFPSQRTMDESGNKGLEEERRLAYVGITRARKRALISHAANRRIYANWQSSIPSRFIDEIPEEHVERMGSTSLAREQLRNAPTVFSGQFPLMAKRPRTVESWEQPGRAARSDTLAPGTRVFHQKFGYGIVKSADDNKLDVEFEKAGFKRVLDNYVQQVSEGEVGADIGSAS